MRTTVIVVFVALFTLAAAPMTCLAAGQRGKSGEIVMKIGGKVHLFHSSKDKAIGAGEEISVFRMMGKNLQPKEVGKVRIVAPLGEHYYEAEIVAGEVKVGDIAKKDGAGYLIQKAK